MEKTAFSKSKRFWFTGAAIVAFLFMVLGLALAILPSSEKKNTAFDDTALNKRPAHQTVIANIPTSTSPTVISGQTTPTEEPAEEPRSEETWSGKQSTRHTAPSARTCTSCKGNGVITCPGCSGQGSSSCSTCGGDGRVTCSGCGGNGRLTCSSCSGDGKATCSQCAGNGRYGSCSTCSGTGKVLCDT